MFARYRFFDRTTTMLFVVVCALLAGLLPASVLRAAPMQQAPTLTLELEAIGDARTQSGSPNTNFGGTLHYFMTPNGHYSFVQFDLAVIPANTIIESAELQFDVLLVNGTSNDVEVGVADGAWDEATLTWANQPGVTWGGPLQTIDSLGVITWDVKRAVKAWHENGAPNHGFVLHGNGGDQVVAGSKESSDPPRLVITVGAPPEDDKPRPDLGDAPDSSNHHGIANTAYPGINGRFPTVWNVPAGQPAGPRHANQTMEAFLGDHLSRENEADGGPDQDGRNNILDGGADNANNDRGDDGWRNRDAAFNHCRPTTLTVRVRKAPNATRNRMYLNVWFDGERDGDWDDMRRCRTGDNGEENGLDVPAYEWIVQNHVVDLSGIAPGDYVDIDVNTEIVLNDSPDKRHWTRFVLSEERALSPGGVGLPDGRGPHPDSALGTYRFGETEDLLQRPQPAGEPGTLELRKRVLTDSDPVDYAGTVTYEIRLRHVGGTAPIEARIEDELPYPLHVLRRINDAGDIELVSVEGTPGGVSPLLAQLLYNTSDPGTIMQLIRWDGTLRPNAEVTLSFDVHVHPLCSPNEQTVEIDNVAEARTRSGIELTETATFTAACPGYTARNIEIEESNANNDVIDIAELDRVRWQGDVRNNNAMPVTLGFFQRDDISSADSASATPLRFLERFEIDPNQSVQVDLALRMENEFTDELKLPVDYAPGGKIVFCILPGEDNVCPDAETHPHLVGEAPFRIRVRPNDLGDAPDSTNHGGVAMAAYPGVQANYPTVFDPATGLPEGPRHSHPRPFHLGQRVSREAEADVGPDQDPTNNIEPAAGTANLDRADDGSRLRNLVHCQRATADVQIFVNPRAAAWFAEQQKPAYLNIWIDSDRDGDWADSFTCTDSQGQNQTVVEHILIDYPVDVAALGAGLHNLPNITTQGIAWPAQLAQRPSWVRFTLSEQKSNKTLAAGGLSYGDGRGFAVPFLTGETEDHLLQPAGGPGDGPDVAVDLIGNVVQADERGSGLRAADASVVNNIDAVASNPAVRFKINYENRGSQAARGALLEFQIPEKLRELEIDLLQAPNIAPDRITRTPGTINLALPDLEPGAAGTVTLGWTGCLTCTVASSSISSGDYTASAKVTLDGDTDPNNDQPSVTVRGLLSSPMGGVLMDFVDDGAGRVDHLVRGQALTCRDEPKLGGRSEPGSPIEIVIDGTVAATVNADGNGRFSVPTTKLDAGDHRIEVRYPDQFGAASENDIRFDRGYLSQGLRLRVDPSLPFDPVSFHFTDSQGRVTLPTLSRDGAINLSGTPFDVQLRSGETYRVEVDDCAGNLNVERISITVGDVLVASLSDDDGDGRYEGQFTYDATDSVGAAGILAGPQTIALIATDGSTESVFAGNVNQLSSGVVRNRSTSQPLANAEIVALSAQLTGEQISFAPWSGAGLGQANPVQSDENGAYGLDVEPGIYRLSVTADGFQPYRTGEIPVESGGLAAEVMLAPEITVAADHTIYVDDSGFTPALKTIKPGSVVEWINVDLTEHSIGGNGHDSGLLAPGESYKMMFDSQATFTFMDSAASQNAATIIVTDDVDEAPARVFLPIVLVR